MRTKAQRRIDRMIAIGSALPRMAIVFMAVEMSLVSVAAALVIALFAFQWITHGATLDEWLTVTFMVLGACAGVVEMVTRWYFRRLDRLIGLEE